MFKVDQINQYGYAITKPLPKGGIRNIKLKEDFNITEFLQNYDQKSSVGHLFCVNLESPEDGINLDLNTQYSPVFIKTEVSPKSLSPYQLYVKKKIGKSGKALKIATAKKVISTLGKQLNVYMFAESLIFLRSIGWKITSVSNHYTFLQGDYMKNYVATNQNERKKPKNVVESVASKAMNNHLYSWLLRNSNSPKLKPIIDNLKEADDWMDDRGKEGNISKNLFAGASYRKMKIQKKYDEDMAKESVTDLNEATKEARKELIDENYQNQMESIKKQLEIEDRCHKKKYPADPVDDINDAMLSTKTRSIVSINTKNSIKGYILEDRLKLESNTRFIGSKVLAFAKIFIAEFVHEVVKIFHELTIKDHVKKILAGNKIEEVNVMMTLTDTDSASFQFITVCDINCLLKQDEIDNLILKILITELKDRLDFSDPFYDKFDMRTPHTKKQMGLFAFEQIGKKIKLCLASNPKEYLEVYSDGDEDNTNFKHKRIKKDSKGMNLKEYAKRLEDLSWLKDHRESLFSSKIVQTRFKKSLGFVKMIALNKIALAQLNDKVYYFENGLMSLPHEHPDLRKIIELRAGKTIEELLTDEIEEKTLVLEDKITLKRKNLRYYSSIMDHVLPNGLTVKKQLLKD